MKFRAPFLVLMLTTILFCPHSSFSQARPQAPPAKKVPVTTSSTDRHNTVQNASCALPDKGSGKQHAVCNHCGCRMSLQGGEELEQVCTVCKCGKKMKECIMKSHSH